MKHLCRFALFITMTIIICPVFAFGQSLEAEMVHRLELALGRPFATSQRRDLEAAAHTATEKLRPEREVFIRNLSRITGMSSQEVSAMMVDLHKRTNATSSIILLLEAKKKGAFTVTQRDELQKAEEHYKTAAYPPIEGFVREAAFILGLDPQDIRPWTFRMGF